MALANAFFFVEEAEQMVTKCFEGVREPKMGSSQSKGSSKDSKNGARGKSSLPTQEKHNSADSKAALTEHAAKFDLLRSLSQSRHASVSGYGDNAKETRTHANDDEDIQSVPRNPTIRVVSDSSATVRDHELEGHSDVSRPPPPPRLRHLSELIDPADLAVDSHIRSPSGKLLAPEQFLVHPNRPLSIRERQEEIKEKVRAASRLGVEAEKAEYDKAPMRDEIGDNKRGKRKLLCACFHGC